MHLAKKSNGNIAVVSYGRWKKLWDEYPPHWPHPRRATLVISRPHDIDHQIGDSMGARFYYLYHGHYFGKFKT